MTMQDNFEEHLSEFEENAGLIQSEMDYIIFNYENSFLMHKSIRLLHDALDISIKLLTGEEYVPNAMPVKDLRNKLAFTIALVKEVNYNNLTASTIQLPKVLSLFNTVSNILLEAISKHKV